MKEIKINIKNKSLEKMEILLIFIPNRVSFFSKFLKK